MHATGGRPLTIGARAASKLLVEVHRQCARSRAGRGGASSAQTSASPSPAAARTDSGRPFEIADNSFFVEEAFNQEAGVLQTIDGGAFLRGRRVGASHSRRNGRRRQLTTSFRSRFRSRAWTGGPGIGDIALNYRYQLLEEGPGPPGHRASPLAGAAERRSIARPGGERSGPAVESACQQAGRRLLLPWQRGL